MLMRYLPSDDPLFAGNWYPFPPPDVGLYDIRQAAKREPVPQGDPKQYFFYFGARKILRGGSDRLLCMGRRVTRMRPEQGWQFRFHQELTNGIPTRYRPFANIYAPPITPGYAPQLLRKDDVSQQLPIARSREEALYIVRQMPTRWPVFRKIHVEYTPELMQS